MKQNKDIVLDNQMMLSEPSLIVTYISKAFKGRSFFTGLTTPEIRKIAAQTFKHLPSHQKDNVFACCESLLKEAKWEYGIVAFDWAYRVRDQYDDQTFYLFESWLEKYVRGWVDVDDFCTHAFGFLMTQRKKYVANVMLWTSSENFWMRRAASVVFIYPIKKNDFQVKDLFEISNCLMNDSHYLVLKGYGWMLKVLSQKKPNEVYAYLLRNKNKMPSLAFRYAANKLDHSKRLNLGLIK